jgi:AraC family cel operon transcriptional repressor
MSVKRYTWNQHHAPAPHLAAARHVADADQEPRWHDHDYYELFWVEAGQGWHLRPDGDEPLEAGDGRCIRPPDVHTFRTAASGLRWINVAINPGSMRALRQRFGAELGWWPWDGDRPHAFRLNPADATRLAHDVQSLPTLDQRRLDLEWFMLGLLRCLEAPGLDSAGPAPSWLADAIQAVAHDPRALQLGIPALVRACGRSERHCNRALRAQHGLSAGELLRQLRLEHAARLLHFSQRPIAAIALDSGFEHLGTFYRCFKQRYGTSPRRFRARAQVA